MTTTDELAPELDDEELPPPEPLFVCDVEVDGEPCGDSFDSKQKLSAHKVGRHRLKKDGSRARPTRLPSGGPGSDGGTSRSTRSRARAAKAKPKPSAPPMDRPTAYTAGLAMIALGAYAAPGPFDQYDLDVANRGIPNLASALAEIAEVQPVVRETLDLVLGGGAGGPYAHLLIASLTIAGPILAHHNVVPRSVGERFGTLAGVTIEPLPARPDVVPSEDAAPAFGPGGAPRLYDPTLVTPEEVVAFYSQVPPNVMTDATQYMMSMAGPIEANVPGGWEPVNGERGPDERPVEPAPTDDAHPQGRTLGGAESVVGDVEDVVREPVETG